MPTRQGVSGQGTEEGGRAGAGWRGGRGGWGAGPLNPERAGGGLSVVYVRGRGVSEEGERERGPGGAGGFGESDGTGGWEKQGGERGQGCPGIGQGPWVPTGRGLQSCRGCGRLN